MPGGVGVGSAMSLAREARQADSLAAPVCVVGPRAHEVAAALAAGSADTGLVQAGGDVRDASALVCLVDDEADLASLRAATREGCPIVGVRLDGTERPVPYVLATDVVAWAPGAPLPAGEIANRLAIRLQRDGRLLAARLPVLRPYVSRVLSANTAIAGAALVALPWGGDAHQPVLSMMQARMLVDLEIAAGRPAPRAPDELALAVGPPLGLATGLGLGARGAYRRLPPSLRRFAGPLIAYVGTRALAGVASRLPLPR